MFKFSAEDIANQTFQTRFRGYDKEQVHEFLDGLAREWRDVQQSFKQMKSDFEEQERELEEYRRREKSLVQALETARQVADDIRDQADRDAEMVMAETELKAEKMLARAEQRVSTLRGEILDLRQRRERFHGEMRQMLESYQSMLDRYEERAEERDEAHPLPPVPGAKAQGDGDDAGADVEVVDDDDIAEQRPASTTSV